MERIYISVILPLRIEWVPCYYLESSGNEESEDGHIVRGSLESRALDSGKESSGYRPIVRGSRVKVRFAGRTYIGVVDEVGITPEVEKCTEYFTFNTFICNHYYSIINIKFTC